VGVRPADLELAKQVATRADQLAGAELRATAAVGGAILTLADEDYPNSLLELELPPPTIWIRGTLAPPTLAVAIVGPRNADAWALDATRHFASELAGAGLCIVSGFARGVDACAHQAALDAGGRTLAVLGSGLGVPYPRHHHPLGDAIAHSGALLSEHPCGRAPQPWHFPIRNRLIAALSFATLVIQASSRSGTLITARQALDLGRDVYALPGRITDARCQGSNRLLRDGALMALDPGSLLEGLPSSVQEQLRQSRPLPAALSGAPVDEVACTLANGVESAEGLSRRLHLPIEDVWVSLLELELAQRVRRLAGGLFEWIP
jgi:DNA processing protein